MSWTRSLTLSWWAVKWAVTNKKLVPNSIKAKATAPFVLNAVPGLVEKLASSGTEQNQIRSRRRKRARCKVPKLVLVRRTWEGPRVSCKAASHSLLSEQDSCVPMASMSGTTSISDGSIKSFNSFGGLWPFMFHVPTNIFNSRFGSAFSNSTGPSNEFAAILPCKKFL